MRGVAVLAALAVVLAIAAFAAAHSEPVSILLQQAAKQRAAAHRVGRQASFESTKPLGESSYLSNINWVTTTGTNAEAYWSFDSNSFSFQAIRGALAGSHPCDQIYIMKKDGSDMRLISGGVGRTTCSFFYPDGQNVLYSSTYTGSAYCPPQPDMEYGYLWPLNKDMDVFVQNLKSRNITPLQASPAYDAEGTISADGKRIIFTSARDGDLELYTMNLQGGDLRRMTYTPGYDGGAWFSWDSKKIVWRANRPTGSNLTDYLNLLNFGLVSPQYMQIYWQDAELIAPAVQVTNNAGTNFAPAFVPDNSAIIFASDMHAPNMGNFQLYMVNIDGSNLQQITTEGNFNAFPMFSPDGKTLAWESDRNTTQMGLINVLTATWVGPGKR